MILNQDFQGTILLMVFVFQGVVKRWALIIYITSFEGDSITGCKGSVWIPCD